MSVSRQGSADRPFEQQVSSAIELPKEFRLVLECARMCAQKELCWGDALRTAEINWDLLMSAALRHRMIPWVHRCLRDHPEEEVPGVIREELRRLTQQIALTSLFLTGELLRVLEVLSIANIPAVPFKGPLLGALCYGDLSLRQCDDIDVLVPAAEVWRATELLQAHGYSFWRPCSKLDQNRLMRIDSAFTLAHEKNHVHLDLHWKFTATGFSFPFKMDSLWRRLEPQQLAGRQVSSFPVEDALLLHCVHGAKHQWERLEWVHALAGLVRSNPDMHWDAVLSQAQQLRAERMLLLGLKLASDLFGTVLPDVFLKRIEHDDALLSLVLQAQMRLVSQDEAPVQEAQQYAFHFRMRESWRDRFRYFIYLMGLKMTPNEEDHKAIPLPALLSSVHYLARPFRLLHTYGLTPLRRFLKVLRSV